MIAMEETEEQKDERKRKKRFQLRLCFAEPDSVMDYIKCYGTEESFSPKPIVDEREATDALPGSPEKIEILRRRAERGKDLWHNRDRLYFGKIASVWNSAPWSMDDEGEEREAQL